MWPYPTSDLLLLVFPSSVMALCLPCLRGATAIPNSMCRSRLLLCVSLSSDGDAATACGSCLEPAKLFCFVYHSKFDVLLWPAFCKVHGGDVLAGLWII
jgi:hypothetical protein